MRIQNFGNIQQNTNFKGININNNEYKEKSFQNNNKLTHDFVKYTGYGALGTGITSGILAKNKKINLHTKFAYAAGILSLIHLALVEWCHHKRK